jgi:hypothetical protein
VTLTLQGNAETYLTDIFQRLPTETNRTVARFTPKAWATV